MLTCVPIFAAILRVPFSIIAPLILVLCAIGAYSVHSSTFDVMLMLVFGVIGYLLKKCNYPLAPLVLAIVLGDKAEEAFRQSLLGSQGSLRRIPFQPAGQHDHDPRTDRAVLVGDPGRIYPLASGGRLNRNAAPLNPGATTIWIDFMTDQGRADRAAFLLCCAHCTRKYVICDNYGKFALVYWHNIYQIPA